MRLNDPLVTEFEYNGITYPIELAYDNVLDVFDVLEDKDLRDYERAEICLGLLIDQPLESPKIDLWNHIYQEFIHVETKRPVDYDLKGNPLPEKESKNTIDFDKDAEFIYASFLQAYNINLFKAHGELHWKEFKALLNGLPKDTIMQRIIQIRLWEPTKGEDSDYQSNMRELQKVYALDNDDEEGAEVE